MKIIDTHTHIIKGAYTDNINEVVSKIKEKNMIVINVPLGVKTSYEVIETNIEHNHLLPVIGIHPDFINRFKESDLYEIEEMINSNVVAIGEIGLDYHRKKDDKELQHHIFESQIKIAIKHNLPIILHILDAHDDVYEVIKKYPNQKFLLHAWSGNVFQTKKYLELSNNIYFSYGGIITWNQEKEHKSWEVPDLMNETIKMIPMNRILFETDCPGLTPEPKKDELNYPWYIDNVFNYASKILLKSKDELIKINNNNSKLFFNLKNINF